MFNFHKHRYTRPGMNEWVQQLADVFLAPDLPEGCGGCESSTLRLKRFGRLRSTNVNHSSESRVPPNRPGSRSEKSTV
jgi:hypothetical protein